MSLATKGRTTCFALTHSKNGLTQAVPSLHRKRNVSMLVLSRRVNQRVVFPTLQTTIELLDVRGQTARLGITAPRDVPLVRQAD